MCFVSVCSASTKLQYELRKPVINVTVGIDQLISYLISDCVKKSNRTFTKVTTSGSNRGASNKDTNDCVIEIRKWPSSGSKTTEV